MAAPCTAFPSTADALRTHLREARLDHPAFDRPLRPCDLSTCRATCCHDGVVLSPEEAGTIRALVGSHPAFFAADTPVSPHEFVTPNGPTFRTALRPAREDECADDFPAHFPRTRCVFLDRDHKCRLQLLSSALGHQPWFFKPISCWMHPILLQSGRAPADRPVLTLLDPSSDPARFASCTPCGRPDPTGTPARDVLAAELRALSQLAGRDLLGELHAPACEPAPSQ